MESNGESSNETSNQNISLKAIRQSIPEVLQQQQNLQLEKKNCVPKVTTKKKKKSRSLYTDEQLDKLNNEFSRRKYPSRELFRKLAEDLNVAEARIRQWFNNARQKEKKLFIASASTNESPSDQLQSNTQPLQEQQAPQTVNPNNTPSNNGAHIFNQEFQNRLMKFNEKLQSIDNYLHEEKKNLAQNFGIDVKLVEMWFESHQKNDASKTVYSSIPLTKEQAEFLEKEYRKKNFQTQEEYKNLSKVSGIDEKSIELWFQNRHAESSSLLQTHPQFTQEQVIKLVSVYNMVKEEVEKLNKELEIPEEIKGLLINNYFQNKEKLSQNASFVTENLLSQQPDEPVILPNPPPAPSQQDPELLSLSDSDDDFDLRDLAEELDSVPQDQQPHQEQNMSIFLQYYKLEDIDHLPKQPHRCNSDCDNKHRQEPVDYEWCKV